MDNKVGDNVPSQKKLDDLLAQLRDVVGELQKFCVTLQPDERKATAKPHKGAEKPARNVHNLAQRYDIHVKNVPLDGMLNDVRLSESIEPFAKALALGAQISADTKLQANSEYYTAFLAYYGALSQAAEHDPNLAAELKETQEEMRKVRQRKGGDDSNNASPPAGPTG
ncbi:MAG: hypothetical protein U0441_04755 [Polyangiaceae bacterium]